MKGFIIICIFLFGFSCKSDDGDFSLKEVLSESKNEILKNVLNDPEKYEYQIIYVQIDRDKNNKPIFKEHRLNVDENRYFYPASTIKMPIAFMALQKLNQLDILGLNKNTRIEFDSLRFPQTSLSVDPTAKDSIPTIGHFVKQIFVVSNNKANNRLYEFVGQDDLNLDFNKKGYRSKITHRLGNSSFNYDNNKITNSLRFLDAEKTLYEQSETVAQFNRTLELDGLRKGVGYIDQADSLISQPFDFSQKNYFPLTEQIEILKSVMFPEEVDEQRKFELTEDSYRFIRTQMSRLPKESKYPVYNDSIYFDSYVKFFIFGDSHANMPGHIRVFNKVGWAYGFLTDCAYVVDFKNEVEFMLAATVHVNENKIYNDGVYEYDDIGIPFLTKLGRTVYEFELNRTRQNPPILTKFKLDYEE